MPKQPKPPPAVNTKPKAPPKKKRPKIPKNPDNPSILKPAFETNKQFGRYERPYEGEALEGYVVDWKLSKGTQDYTGSEYHIVNNDMRARKIKALLPASKRMIDDME